MEWFLALSPAIQGLLATLFTYFVTAVGASLVFFFKDVKKAPLHLMMEFAAGVMIAASFWSLLSPAIELSASLGHNAWLTAAIGFCSGGLFIIISDILLSKMSSLNSKSKGYKRSLMLVGAVTLHNIPEGLAVGVAFGALQEGGYTTENLMGAISVAVGIGLQNFPEGAAVSVPLRREGYSRKRSFFLGQASGMVEPIAGVIGALLVVYVEAILPYALSFAAGAMILVAVHELIPECQENQTAHPYSATMGIILGFAVMMLMDVMLG